jgi:hypothetical protein
LHWYQDLIPEFDQAAIEFQNTTVRCNYGAGALLLARATGLGQMDGFIPRALDLGDNRGIPDLDGCVQVRVLAPWRVLSVGWRNRSALVGHSCFFSHIASFDNFGFRVTFRVHRADD